MSALADPAPLHLALAGYEHEWPADFEAFVARELVGRDGAFVARIAELGEAPAFLGASEVTALIVNANRLGLTGKVALRECRRLSPSTAVVVVGDDRGSRPQRRPGRRGDRVHLLARLPRSPAPGAAQRP